MNPSPPPVPPAAPAGVPETTSGGAGPGQAPAARSGRRDAATLVVAVLARPDLWWTALAELVRMAPRLWWRTPPRLPVPDRRLWRFRMVTAYGSPDAAPTRADVVSFLEWCRAASAAAPSRPGGHG